MASAGFEPANLDTKGQHATPRPPKPLIKYNILKIIHGLNACYRYGRPRDTPLHGWRFTTHILPIRTDHTHFYVYFNLLKCILKYVFFLNLIFYICALVQNIL